MRETRIEVAFRDRGKIRIERMTHEQVRNILLDSINTVESEHFITILVRSFSMSSGRFYWIPLDKSLHTDLLHIVNIPTVP